METILDISVDPQSYEEQLPGYSPEFPYICSRALLSRYRRPFVPWHWHGTVELFYVESGCIEYATPQGTILFPQGSGGFVNPNVLHSSRVMETDGETVQLVHLFDPVLLPGAQNSRIAQKYIQPLTASGIERIGLFPGKNDGILELLRQSFALDTQEMGYEFRLVGLLSRIWLGLLELSDQQTVSSATDGALKKMMVYLYEHYSESISVDDLAGAGGVSKRGCFRLFRQQLRATPTDYLRQYRLQKASALLCSGALPITEIAYRCGLGSSSYFGKLFREQYGCSPRVYRIKWHDRDSFGQESNSNANGSPL